MTPELKDISSVDWDGSTVLPAGSCVWFHLEIGEAGRSGADLFQMGVCDQTWKNLNIRDETQGFSIGDAHFAGEALLLLASIDMAGVRQAVTSVLRCLGAFDDWHDFARAMKGIAAWEFDGMQV